VGLDVTAYEKVTLKQAMTIEQYNDMVDRDGEPGDEYVVLYYAGFEERADGMPQGVYLDEGKSMEFRAGSYSGYNQWRANLALLVGTTDRAVWNDPQPGPFVELINFSDCDGFIGPQTSAKLAADFAAWQDRAADFADTFSISWWLDAYSQWRKAFELAANGGVVRFH
jgi:hypothetical protein